MLKNVNKTRQINHPHSIHPAKGKVITITLLPLTGGYRNGPHDQGKKRQAHPAIMGRFICFNSGKMVTQLVT